MPFILEKLNVSVLTANNLGGLPSLKEEQRIQQVQDDNKTLLQIPRRYSIYFVLNNDNDCNNDNGVGIIMMIVMMIVMIMVIVMMMIVIMMIIMMVIWMMLMIR